ncbi:ring-cleaving dioxygenase [Geomicrobium sp. JCM 19039]|uniref:ring-cleaving dioxygenase n=1 Tax=Geomicrobium sp. JCM 19039 TaxID=1460636 RepID=UPI00045F46A0|nr:ring-cleaving dioxygenase [Geomicrobium sp. JCM 19039]GAK13528.1 glyoxalase family protein [Geomicrobium sp. JCM 19039]
MKLRGQHHISSLTKDAKKNLAFYRNVLGMKLVKKTVNQDNTSFYHLFYADEQGTPGTEVTFFEIPNLAQKHDGTNTINEISLRVSSVAALSFWKTRFERYQVTHNEVQTMNDTAVLPFQDPEGHKMLLVAESDLDDKREPSSPEEIPNDYNILGLGPVRLKVQYVEPTSDVLTDVLGFTKKGEYKNGEHRVFVFEADRAGLSGQVHVEEDKTSPKAREGRGSVHHVAFRVETEEELQQWVKRIEDEGFQTSGFVDRYYFRSLYFREPNGILYELATDGPGFAIDEPVDQLGKSLSLPDFLEPNRKEIEAKLQPLQT